jgi:uncharacterized protein
MNFMQRFYKKTKIPVGAQKLYEWHTSGGAFRRLTPPWENIDIVSWKGGEKTSHLSEKEQWGDITKGSQVCISLKQGPVKLHWNAEHIDCEEGVFFVDRQSSGPFAKWEHHHRFIPIDEDNSYLEDEIHYQLPFSPIGNIGLPFMKRKLESMFSYRHEITKGDLQAFSLYPSTQKLKIAMTGASGLIGRQLKAYLQGAGHEIFPMNRRLKGERNEIVWSPKGFDPTPLEGMDAIIHLAGESIGSRWTKSKKTRILQSRLEGTKTIAEAISQLSNPPTTLISASAIGFYGNRDSETLTEKASKGEGFLADVCEGWEQSTQKAKDIGIRVIHPRIGIVISAQGGALQPMILPFSMGLGGVMGSGRQYMSWIGLDDVLDMFLWMLIDTRIEGIVNVTNPHPVTNKEFTDILGQVLKRPTFFPVPAFALKIILGEMAQGLILDGAKVTPQKAIDHDFQWRYNRLEESMRHELGKQI